MDTVQNSLNSAVPSLGIESGDNSSTAEYYRKVNAILGGLKVDIKGYYNEKNDIKNETAAVIGNGGTIHAGEVVVSAAENTILDAMAGAGVANMTTVGGSVLITTVKGNVESYAGGTIHAPVITISAKSDVKTTSYKAVIGSAGFATIGAGVAIMDVAGNVYAYVSTSAQLDGEGTKTITADQDVNINAVVDNVSLSLGLTVGASIAKVTVSTDVKAYAGIGAAVIGDSVIILAATNGSVTVVSTASNAGAFGAGVGSEATITVSGNTKAYVMNGASVQGTKNVKIQASSLLNTKAQAIGNTISAGVTVGVVSATVTVKETVLAEIQKDASVKAGEKVQVLAYYNYG